MSYQNQYSICNGESSMDNWYRNSIASDQESETILSSILCVAESAFSRESMALPSATFYDQSHDIEAVTRNEGFAMRNKNGLRVSAEKPLPALPESPDWAYMFSDANEEEVDVASLEPKSQSFLALMSASPTQPSFYFGDASSPPEYQPATPTNSVYDSAHYNFDGAAIKQETPSTSIFDANYVTENVGSTPFGCAPASPTINTGHVVGNFAVSTSLDSDEAEIIDATAGFYGGYIVEESPSPYHAPNIDEDAGFGDIRDGCENFPEQWTNEETPAEVVAPYKASAISTPSGDFELLAPKPLKPVLKPRSQIAKAARACDMGFSYTRCTPSTPRHTSLPGFGDEAPVQINGKQSCTFFPTVVDSRTCTKRPVRDTVLSSPNKKSDADCDNDEEDEEPQSAKRARLSSHNTMDADAVYATMPSTFTLFPDLKRKSSSCSISNSIFHHAGGFAPTVDGYPGQFLALIPPSKVFHPKFLCGVRPSRVTFGNVSHANGLFHHCRFQPGSDTLWNEYGLDFSKSAVPYVYGLVGKAFKLADENLILSASNERTAAEERLRRETHFECAMARLEGVAVGEYRYYQGHSSIEEYNKGGMCICWEECFCTKMCGRYADMLCPCKKYIQFEE